MLEKGVRRTGVRRNRLLGGGPAGLRLFPSEIGLHSHSKLGGRRGRIKTPARKTLRVVTLNAVLRRLAAHKSVSRSEILKTL